MPAPKFEVSPHPFVVAKAMTMPQLKRRRRIWAFVPPAYFAHPTTRFPVIYFHDAQNIFEGWKAPFGQSWEVHNTLRQLAAQGYPSAILVGIEHGKRRRVREFQPLTPNGNLAKEGNAYADFIANKVKPYIDKHLRTLPDRQHTGLVGSSMGGLITLFTGLKHQDVFSRLGVFSPSLWASPALYALSQRIGRHYPMKIYLTVGLREGHYTVHNTRAMFQVLHEAGFPEHELYLGLRPEGQHHEQFWRHEFATCYQWLMN